LGQKVAITSSKPQTTRNRIPGVVTQDGVQLILVDTPGLHKAKGLLNTFMVDVAEEALWDTDVVVLIVEPGLGPEGQLGVSPVIQGVLDKLSDVDTPTVLVLNKVDKIDKPDLLPMIAAWSDIFDFHAIVPLSALDGEGVDTFVKTLGPLLPEGPFLYPPDTLTDLPERFIAGELVREQLFKLLEQEMPYSVAVLVEEWRDRSSRGIIDISAVIAVERDSQKAIVIGRRGQMIKDVGIRSRKALERMLGIQVNLKLHVKVEKGWTRSQSRLGQLGYKK